MKLAGAERAEVARRIYLYRGAKFFRQPRRLEARQRQMWQKRPLLARDAQFLRGIVDIRREYLEIRRSIHAGPENARRFFIWKEAHAAEFDRHLPVGTHG